MQRRFYANFDAVNSKWCFHVFTMSAAPHPFSIGNLLERWAARCLCAFYGEAIAAIYQTALKANNARAVMEDRCHRKPFTEDVMEPADRGLLSNSRRTLGP